MWWLLNLLVLILVAAVTARISRRMMEAVVDDMARFRWEPVAPGPAHARLTPVVTALEAEGYLVDSHATLPMRPRPSPAVTLVHPDGSLALVRADRAPIGIVSTRLVLQSILIVGERHLTTVAYATVMAPPEALFEVAARRPDVPRAVARHRAARRWLASQGVAVVPVEPGAAGSAVESGMRMAARRRHLESTLVVRMRALVGGGRFRRPVAERPELAPVVWDVRRRQRELAEPQR